MTPNHPSNIIFFFFNDTATTEIYPLSLHDALPISQHDDASLREEMTGSDLGKVGQEQPASLPLLLLLLTVTTGLIDAVRSEEHTSELQSQSNLVCRLLLEKKKKYISCSNCESCLTS